MRPVQSPPEPTEPQPPVAIPDHELVRCVGRGAYGEVWLARNVLGEYRAVKIIHRRNFSDARPFEREFEGIRRFEPISRSHPSQLAILHVGRNDASGCFYYVMELADDANAAGDLAVPPASPTAAARSGPAQRPSLADPAAYVPRTLRHELQTRGRLPVADSVRLGCALATALAHLHRHGLVHRDVKPSNVIFVGGVPKLADIGLVADAGDDVSQVGTDGYLSPDKKGTPAADCYSLGKVLYELSSGLSRFDYPEPAIDLLTRPDRERLLELNAVIHRACAPDPHERYADAEAMLHDLELLEGGRSVRRRHAWRRSGALAARVLAVVAVLVGVTATLATFRGQERRVDYAGEGPPSTNTEATALCAKGLLILRSDNVSEHAAAYTNFMKAIALDPNFGRPYVGLLEMNLREANVPDEADRDFHTLAARLDELAPGTAAAHTAQAIASYYDWDYPAAERHARQAVKAGPGYELGHTWYGFMLTFWQRREEARRQVLLSLEIAPAKAVVHRCMGHQVYAGRNFTNSAVWYRRAIELDQHHSPEIGMLGRTLWALQDYTNAISYLEQARMMGRHDPQEVRVRYTRLRHALEQGGPRGYWEECWRQAVPEPNEDLYDKAVIQSQLGNTNAALDWLEKASDRKKDFRREQGLHCLLFDEYWDGYRQHPRFRRLLEQLSYAKVMPADLR